MSKYLQYAVLAVTRPSELRALATYYVWHEPAQDITKMKESGYERETMKRCWEFLDLTSRSFSAVIKELEGELCRVVCLFYLVLRGLDTIEDDMTLDLEKKAQLLESFYEKLSTPGWTFSESGPAEKDRQLLVEFDKVITELMSLDESYKSVITRICQSMGHGMAKYARAATQSQSTYAIDTLRDFDLYCHYVAGIVGEGLSGLFSASGKEAPDLAKRLTLSNSMGLMLQKTNIMRDFREDLEDGRFFWPREIWGKYTSDPKDFYIRAATDPEMRQKAFWALSEMIMDALAHATDCLDYLSLCKNQTIFNFCAIPQVMAIATLDVCFMNPNVFVKNVKISKGHAVKLIQQCSNPREVAKVFVEHMRSIVKRADPADPSYIKLCVALGQIEQWYENRFPSWIFNDGKVIAIPTYADEEGAAAITDARVRQLPMKRSNAAGNAASEDTKFDREDWKLIAIFVGGIGAFMLLIFGSVGGLVWYFGKHSGMGRQIVDSLDNAAGAAVTTTLAGAPSAKIEL